MLDGDEGDRGFDAFFRSHYDSIVRSLTLAFGDRGEAEDAAQVAFERALRRWRRVRHMERPATWVYVVAVRQERRRLSRSGHVPASRDVVADSSAEVVDAGSLEEALGALPPRQRTAVVLRYLVGLSVAETAVPMHCAEGTVKAAVHAALAKLRVALEEEVGAGAP